MRRQERQRSKRVILPAPSSLAKLRGLGRNSVAALMRRCRLDENGISTAEYALVLAIIGTAIAIAAIALGNKISQRSAGHPAPATTPVRATRFEVKSGEGAFVRPADMQVDRWYPIEFIAGPSEESLLQESEDLALTPARPIFLSRKMRVVLLPDPNFDIRTKSETLQDTGSDLTTGWAWDVKPKADGTHTLIAQVEVLSPLTDGRYRLLNRYSRRVSVRVGVGTVQAAINDIQDAKSLGDALTALLQSWRATIMAFSALLIAVIVARAGLRRFRRRTAARRGKEIDPACDIAT